MTWFFYLENPKESTKKEKNLLEVVNELINVIGYKSKAKINNISNENMCTEIENIIPFTFTKGKKINI